jgi:hypothetical protein
MDLNVLFPSDGFPPMLVGALYDPVRLFAIKMQFASHAAPQPSLYESNHPPLGMRGMPL